MSYALEQENVLLSHIAEAARKLLHAQDEAGRLWWLGALSDALDGLDAWLEERGA